MSWVSECADRWVGKGANEQQAMEGAIREALEHAAEVAEDGRHECDGNCTAPNDCADAIRALAVEP